VANVQKVREAMADDTNLKQVLREKAAAIRQTPAGAGVSVVVTGHTHDRDATDSYVNLGTWIDFVAGLKPEQLANAKSELPVLRIAPDAAATLFDAKNLLKMRTLDACPVLWSSPAAPGGLKAPPPQAVPSPPCVVPGRGKARRANSCPVETSTDNSGYSYVETSDSWKETCRALPCFAAMQWPDYATTVRKAVIDGQEVVVQLWKGWCQQFLALASFPGGIGAEVGIYKKIPKKQLPEDLSFVDSALRPLMIATGKAGGDAFWWPSPDLEAILGFALVHPVTGETFFEADPEKTYWLNRWMSTASYDEFKKRNPGKYPAQAVDWKLVYSINGEEQEPW